MNPRRLALKQLNIEEQRGAVLTSEPIRRLQ